MKAIYFTRKARRDARARPLPPPPGCDDLEAAAEDNRRARLKLDGGSHRGGGVGGQHLSNFKRLAKDSAELVKHRREARDLARAAGAVHARDYPFGEAALVRANLQSATLTWCQLAWEVLASGDTVFSFDPEVCAQLFGVIDASVGNRDGYLTAEEIMAAGSIPAVVEYINESEQPILESLVLREKPNMSKMAKLRLARVKRAFLEAVDTDKDGKVSQVEWIAFIEAMGDERLRYLKQ